ncbi:Acetyl esterase/lipase [Collimonas sp. OK242]|uniref:alpha/beta hydrolase n=1 Tax=Collimonas sp. OK242 TaxID=1798195 RepID=UPI0008962DE4|nr:alpha/beta hydrolase [Collimonas sp. OK242]SDY96684.1 Acetyl esterase/lipase [Collimonas sp. OK242]
MNDIIKKAYLTSHPITVDDKAKIFALRAMVEPLKGKLQGIAAREPFDGIMNRVSPPDGVFFESDNVGGISGWWCRPSNARSGEVILHLHGGWFNWGSALAFRHFVGHIAAHASVDAFIPDYRLAPEHPHPAAIEDVLSCYDGLIKRGIKRIALVGDSAGGGLALVLLSLVIARRKSVIPAGAVALSPVTDLSLAGDSWETRASADPYFTRLQVAGLVQAYLGKMNPTDHLASALYGNLTDLPPIRVHVGDDEVLLDDSRRYVDRAVAAGVDAQLHIWEGMPHGFASNAGKFDAANNALAMIGQFLTERLAGTTL